MNLKLEMKEKSIKRTNEDCKYF